MQQILVFAGSQQSGKSTSAKFVAGQLLKEAGVITNFTMPDNGDLLVNGQYTDINGQTVKTDHALLDFNDKEYEFLKFAETRIFPFVKIYSFANLLKDACIAIFSLDKQNVYGSNLDKQKPTKIKWRRIWELLPLDWKNLIIAAKRMDDFLTHRELLQVFGTDICRVFDNECWVNASFDYIQSEGYPNVIIDDARFPNEVISSLDNNGKAVLLTRQIGISSHKSEQIVKMDRSRINFVIDNQNLSLKEKNDKVLDIIYNIGWIKTKIN